MTIQIAKNINSYFNDTSRITAITATDSEFRIFRRGPLDLALQSWSFHIVHSKNEQNSAKKNNLPIWNCDFPRKFALSYSIFRALWISQRSRKFKKVHRQKNSWNQINPFFSWNCIFGRFKLFPCSKIDF